MSRIWKVALVGLATALVAGCSGGGRADPYLTVTPASIQRTVEPNQAGSTFVILQASRSPQQLYAGAEFDHPAIESLEFTSVEEDEGTIQIHWKGMPVGVYTGTITIHLCYDALCERELDRSPATIPATLTVTEIVVPPPPPPEPEVGVDPLPIVNQQALVHDVVDARYSSALDKIVIVSSQPGPALYLYDPVTNTEQSIALDQAPGAVSVSPDGLSAAVGHNQLITLVDLANIDDPIVSPKTLLNVTADVFALVLAGNGYVYAWPREPHTVNIRSIEIATNTETIDSSFVQKTAHPALHPSGTALYAFIAGDMVRFDISTGPIAAQNYSPYTNEFPMCGDVWMHEEGLLVYTACGATFRPSDVLDLDMRYGGSLDFIEQNPDEARIKSLSHSAERDEVALLEQSEQYCQTIESENCYTHFALYQGDYLDPLARYSLAPVEVAGEIYMQRGLFVFHSADGTARYLISRLLDAPAEHEYRVGAVEVTPPPDPEPIVSPAPVMNVSTETGILAAPLTEIAAVPHDVVDAEFSAALNAIVMVSRYPSNALYVHDLATRTERSIALVKAPKAVSIGPDGMFAAVGHDGLVSLVDLSPGAGAPQLFNASLDIVDVVLASNGYIHAFPGGFQGEFIHSVSIATSEETFSGAEIRANARARLHPSGTKMYSVGTTSFPLGLERYSTTGGTAQVEYSWPYLFEYNPCRNLWLSESGATIYTACGDVFASSDVQNEDMVHAGALELTTFPQPASDFYRMVSASETAEAQELALLEQRDEPCATDNIACTSHVNLYDSGTLSRTARYSLSPFTVGPETYPQRGVFVFHNGDGSQRYVVSRLVGIPNPFAEFYISRLQ